MSAAIGLAEKQCDVVYGRKENWPVLTRPPVAQFNPPGDTMRHSSLDLRTTNPIESIFATVRLRTNAAKRFKKTKSGVYLMHQVIDRLSKNWRRLRSAHLCPTVPLPMSSKSKQSKVA